MAGPLESSKLTYDPAMKRAPIGYVFEMIQLIIDQLTEPGMTRKRFKILTT